jgi:tetratricopeptide (TPR) repeat protein
VELQKSARLESAGNWFEMATQLNPDNVVAKRNLEINRKFRAGEQPVVEIPRSVEDLFGAGRSWDQVLSVNGPFDDPSLRLLQAFIYVQTGLYRQAAQCFDRVRECSGTNFPSRLWLAQLELLANQPDAALKLTREVREHPDRFPLDITNRLDLLSVETSALFARKDAAKAVELVEATLGTNPQDERLLTAASAIYNQHGQFSNSLTVVDRQLAINAENPTALLNKGYICIQLKAYDLAITALNQLLKLETNNPSALLNRAIACLHSDKLPQAKADYENLVRQYPTTHQLYYGLAEIALRQHDTNAAIRHTETYLTNAPPNTPEYLAMGERLRTLKNENSK